MQFSILDGVNIKPSKMIIYCYRKEVSLPNKYLKANFIAKISMVVASKLVDVILSVTSPYYLRRLCCDLYFDFAYDSFLL